MRYISNDKTFTRSTDHLTKDSFKQNLSARSSLVSAFKPRRLDLKKDAVPTIFNFKIGIGQKRSHGNKQPCPPKSEQLFREAPNLSVQRFQKEEI